MSNDTRSVLNNAAHAPREGVFIPRKQVQKMRRAQDLLDDARRRARGLVKEAQQQAAEVRRQAFAAGYEDGALAAASHVLAHFGATQALAQNMRDDLERHARHLLGEALNDPATVLALFDECLKGLGGPPNQLLTIRLPAAMRGQRARLDAMLALAGRHAVDIGYWDDPRLMVLYGEQVFEFDPPTLIDQGQRRLLNNCPDFPDACRRLGSGAAQRWRDAFEQDFIGPEGDAEEELK